MPMSPRLLRPRAGGVHPDAGSWRSRAVANGGIVSATTLKAVDTFCRAIDSAGLRGRFFRLSLMCGSNLAACLTPLYRGQSVSGTQFGGTTDTNYNFVSGDYVETGSTGGLLGNGSNKSLQTGLFLGDIATPYDAHCAVYWSGTDPVSTSRWLGTFFDGIFMCETSSNSVGGRASENVFMSGTITATGTAQQGQHITTRTADNDARHFRNGSSIVQRTTSITSSFTSTASLAVFGAATDSVGGVNSPISRRISAYSFGKGFSVSQAAAYYTALQAFQTALSRNV
jgi:hypothetical protein